MKARIGIVVARSVDTAGAPTTVRYSVQSIDAGDPIMVTDVVPDRPTSWQASDVDIEPAPLNSMAIILISKAQKRIRVLDEYPATGALCAP